MNTYDSKQPEGAFALLIVGKNRHAVRFLLGKRSMMSSGPLTLVIFLSTLLEGVRGGNREVLFFQRRMPEYECHRALIDVGLVGLHGRTRSVSVINAILRPPFSQLSFE